MTKDAITPDDIYALADRIGLPVPESVDPRRCGWMADQGGKPCGERAVVAAQVEVFDNPEVMLTKHQAGLPLCERHNFTALTP